MRELYRNLVDKYGTKNPIKLAEIMGITIIYNQLGNTSGIHTNILGIDFIHINTNLNVHEEYYTIAHELGHCILHNGENINFLRKHTLFPITKLEFEADLFASFFVIDDTELKEINNIYQVAESYGLSYAVCEKRYEYLKNI